MNDWEAIFDELDRPSTGAIEAARAALGKDDPLRAIAYALIALAEKR